MYAQLGNIRFEGLKGFSSFEESFAVNYAQHERINGKPRLQAVGDVLDTISFEMYLHARFADIEADIAILRAYMQNREILPLILGTGRVLGNFVIPSLTHTTSFTDTYGNLLEATISVELIECFNDEPLRQANRQAQASAFATAQRNSNVRTVLPPKASEGMGVTQNVSKIEASGKIVNQNVAAVQQNPATADYYSGKITGSLDQIEGSIQTIQTTLSQAQNLSNLAGSLPSALLNVNTAVQNMRSVLPISDISDFLIFNSQLQSAILTAKNANVGISNQSIIRRI